MENAKSAQTSTRGSRGKNSKTNTHFQNNTEILESNKHTPSHTRATEPINTAPPNGGRLKNFFQQWEKLTRDPQILDWIRGYRIPLLGTPYQSKIPSKLAINIEQNVIPSKEVANMQEMGVIQKVSHTKGEIISNVFMWEKKEKDQYRLIVDLKPLNSFIPHEKFKVETLKIVKDLSS